MTRIASAVRPCVRSTPSPPRPKSVTAQPVLPRIRRGKGGACTAVLFASGMVFSTDRCFANAKEVVLTAHEQAVIRDRRRRHNWLVQRILREEFVPVASLVHEGDSLLADCVDLAVNQNWRGRDIAAAAQALSPDRFAGGRPKATRHAVVVHKEHMVAICDDGWHVGCSLFEFPDEFRLAVVSADRDEVT